MYLGIIV